MTVAGRRAASTRTRSTPLAVGGALGHLGLGGGELLGGGLKLLRLLDDQAGRAVLVVDPSAHDDDRGRRPARPRPWRARCRRPAARPGPRGRRAWRTSSGRPSWCGSAWSPPRCRPRGPTRRRGGRPARPASSRPAPPARSRTALSGCSEMNRPSASFSTASSCARSNSSAGIGGWAGANGLRRAGRSPLAAEPVAAEVEDRALADLGVLLGLLARALRGFEHDQHPLARGAGGVEGAALDQRLDRALVHGPGVHALAEVPQRRERAALLARAP